MSLRKTLLGVTAAALCLGTAATAQAAGFQLKEQSSSMQGHAFAGATAKADDLSTMFFNPAGLTRVPEGNQISLTSSYILPSAKFSAESVTPGIAGPVATDGNGGDAGVGALVPSFYSSFDLGLGDRWRTGLSVNTPFGLATKYKRDWVGRFYAVESELLTINVAPTVAYKLTDTLSIGGNVQGQYAEAKLTNATALGVGVEGFTKLEGDDIAFGWGLGALWEARPDTRVGVNYRSRIVHKLDGDIRVTGPTGAPVIVPGISGGASAGVTTPDILSVGVVHDLNDRWSVLADVAWTNWSLFDDLTVITDSGAQAQSVEQDYHDTFFFALGAEYKHTPEWTFRGGAAFDQGAVGTRTRTFRIPDSDRYWTSLGASYAFAPNLTFDVNYTHIFTPSVRVTEDSSPITAGVVSGKYDANVNIVTAGVNFKF